MTISARHSSPAFHFADATLFREFPYEFAAGDPGVGSQSGSSIAVQLGDSSIVVAWNSHGTSDSVDAGTFPPAGYGYPAQPSQAALTAALKWWPQGFHHQGRVSWSRNFGMVISSHLGLLPSGEVCRGNYCYPYIPNATRKWTFLAYSSIANGAANPYSGNANAWSQHIGYDLARRKDLVLWEDNAFQAFEYLQVYEISATIPATRGSLVWQGTNGDRSLNRHFKAEGGCQFIQIPWLGKWWVIQYAQTSGATDQVWGFAPTASPASSGSSTPAGFDVTVPTAVRTMAQGSPLGGGNLHFVVDQMGQRVFAYQFDWTQTAVGGKYPLLVWEVNPSTFEWASVSLASTLRVDPAGKLNLSPMAYFGGYQFKYFDARGSASVNYGDALSISGNPIPAQTKKTGGFYVREIFIPKASPPRSMTWTQRNYSASALSGGFNLMKHSEMTFNSTDGKMYVFGGDHGTMGDSTLPSGSYNNQVLSFTPESGADLALLENACPASASINHPIRVDENGFQYRASSNDFWMMVGYSDADWVNNCGWASRAAWEAAGGGNAGKVWKWTDAGGWVNAGGFVAKSGFAGRVWSQSESSCRRWYYDAVADKIIAPAYGSGGDTGMQTTTVQILDTTPVGGNYEFAKYQANECFNGLGGNKTLTPDGRPINDTVMGAVAMWSSDRAAVDPATGYTYVYQPATGDVYRIHTRANFYTGGNGLPSARIEWVCKIIPTGTRSNNLAHFVWAKSALWMFIQSATGRLRVFSWAEGESAPTEHLTPTGAIGGAVAKYSVTGDERICIIGNQAQSSWSTTVQAGLSKYWTVTLS